MNCPETKKSIHAYIDGELDATHSVAIEEHLRGCAICSRIEREQQSLKSALGTTSLRFKMPAAVRKQIVSEIHQTIRPVPRWSFWSSPWALGSAIAIAMMSLFFVIEHGQPASGPLIGEITSSHVRSMMANHLMDVVSTDQHTVKPWFDGKLDFAPPVKNLDTRSFPLSGGRLEYLDGHSAAALVYMRQKHIINLFIWPATSPAQKPGPGITNNGYHLINWTESGMTFWAVSDLNEKELRQFVETFRQN